MSSSSASNDFSGVLAVDECASFDVRCALPLVHHCASVYSFTVSIFGRPVGLGEDRNDTHTFS